MTRETADIQLPVAATAAGVGLPGGVAGLGERRATAAVMLTPVGK
jgi:hypothetical protein